MSTTHTVIVNELVRLPEAGPEDRLEFSSGVNVLVGPPNTGKTKWLQMLDFVFGDDDSAVDAFGDVVATKYTSILAQLTVAGESWKVERRWDVATPKNRVFVNEEATTVKDFLHTLLSRLEIPILHYPQGNPYGQRSWRELGWRSLYRHIYRRQHRWGDIADRQPESEQHACIVQFTGLAKHLFSEEYVHLVEKQKKIIELQAQKEQYMSVLSQVSKDLLSAEEIGVGLTPQSLATARTRIVANIERLRQEREAVLSALSATLKSQGNASTGGHSRLDELSEESAALVSRYEDLRCASERTFPLTKGCCLVLDWSRTPQVLPATEFTVANCNLLRIGACWQYLFADDSAFCFLDEQQRIVRGELQALQRFASLKKGHAIEILGGTIARRPPNRLTR